MIIKNFFKKKPNLFYQYFQKIIVNLEVATEIFIKQLENLDDSVKAESFFQEIKALEQKGDKYTHHIIVELNKAFITPLESEDIMDLALRLDDVLNCLMFNASNILMYNVKETDQTMKLFIQNIQECMKEMYSAVELLTQDKLQEMTKHTHIINNLEDSANETLRSGLKELFHNSNDPIELIKKKEIYSMMESFSDAIEDVANTLEGIIMRNS